MNRKKNLNTNLTGSEIQREESSYILMQVKARFIDIEARAIIPATASPFLQKKIITRFRIFFKCLATLQNDYFV